MGPDDKPKQTDEAYEDPKLFIVIGSEKLQRPGLETAFVDYSDPTADTDKDGSKTIGGVICSCNKVRVTACDCVGYTPSKSSGGSGGRSGCRCAPVS